MHVQDRKNSFLPSLKILPTVPFNFGDVRKLLLIRNGRKNWYLKSAIGSGISVSGMGICSVGSTDRLHNPLDCYKI